MLFFFFQAEDGIRDYKVTGVQTCALPICGTREEVLDQGLPVRRNGPVGGIGGLELVGLRRGDCVVLKGHGGWGTSARMARDGGSSKVRKKRECTGARPVH